MSMVIEKKLLVANCPLLFEWIGTGVVFLAVRLRYNSIQMEFIGRVSCAFHLLGTLTLQAPGIYIRGPQKVPISTPLSTLHVPSSGSFAQSFPSTLHLERKPKTCHS